MKIIVITGPPYSGKGTQCELLETTLGYQHISTGERIRAEKENNTKIGKVMKDYEEQGMLVPDEIMKALLTQILVENRKEKGIILDGYPRTKPQVDTLLSLLKENKQTINQVINIVVPTKELLKRAKERAKNSTRKDDKDERVHIKRIEVFEENTQAAINYLKTIMPVVDIDGMGSIEAITDRIKRRLKS